MSFAKRLVILLCILFLTGVTILILLRPDLFKNDGEPENEESVEQEPQAAMTVTVTKPRQENLTVELPVDGRIAAWEESAISTELSEKRIDEVLVNVGDYVRKGQVLARFSSRTLNADLDRAEASLVEALANLDQARSDLQNVNRVRRTGAVSKQDLVKYRIAEKTARAKVRSARASLASQQASTGYTELRAPDEGVISSRSASTGAVPSTGTELFRLIRHGRLEWRAEVMANDLSRVMPGQYAYLSGPNERRIDLQVRSVAPKASDDTGKGLVYLDIPENVAARAGMYLGGSIVLGHSDALTVPMNALVARDGFSYVYSVGNEGRVSRIQVKPGRIRGDRIEISSEKSNSSRLGPTTPIVSEGAGFLNEGDLVRIASGAEDSAKSKE